MSETKNTPASAGSPGSAGSAGTMAIYRTDGPRTKDHRVVLYLDADRAWTARHFARNGSQYPPLARVPMPPEAMAYSARSARAASLRYNGHPPQDAAGLAEDIRSLGLDEDSVVRLVSAAAPHLSPNTESSATAGADGIQPEDKR